MHINLPRQKTACFKGNRSMVQATRCFKRSCLYRPTCASSESSVDFKQTGFKHNELQCCISCCYHQYHYLRFFFLLSILSKSIAATILADKLTQSVACASGTWSVLVILHSRELSRS